MFWLLPSPLPTTFGSLPWRTSVDPGHHDSPWWRQWCLTGCLMTGLDFEQHVWLERTRVRPGKSVSEHAEWKLEKVSKSIQIHSHVWLPDHHFSTHWWWPWLKIFKDRCREASASKKIQNDKRQGIAAWWGELKPVWNLGRLEDVGSLLLAVIPCLF